MKNKKILILLLMTFAIIISLNLVNAICCEKTTGDEYCVSVPPENSDACAPGFRASPSSCQETTYCSTGTCVNTDQGTCTPSPRTTCNSLEGGLWVDDSPEDVPQCQVGCCLIGEQANFITETACLSRVSDLEEEIEYEFLSNIHDGNTCAALANPSERGACVNPNSAGGRECSHETREDCQESGLDFYEGFLCTAPELNTKCVDTDQTTCVNGKEEVYFKDSCGNIANIYNAEKRNDIIGYWTEMINWVDSCVIDPEDPESIKDCGNCVFRLGSTCGEYRPGEDLNPTIGDYVCRDMGCWYDNDNDQEKEYYDHDERWCADAGWIEGTPGKEELVLKCYNGVISKERCSSYRSQVCLETTTTYSNGVEDTQAACVINNFGGCYGAQTKSDCEDESRGDCNWTLANQDPALYDAVWSSTELGIPESIEDSEKGFCVPTFSPGIKFWEEESAASCYNFVPQGYTCGAEYEKGLLGDWNLVEDETCFEDTSNTGGFPKTDLNPTWQRQMKNVCLATSDCGVKTNYLNVSGYYSWKDLFVGDYVSSSLRDRNSYGGGI